MNKIKWVISLILISLVVMGFKMVSANNEKITLQSISKLTDQNGKSAQLYIDPNKPTFVKFWASWCPLCLSELEKTEALRHDPRFEQVNIVTVVSPGFLNEKNKIEFIDWYNKLDFAVPPALLDNGSLVKTLKLNVYPSWVLFDANGNVERIVHGSVDEEQLLALAQDMQQELTQKTHNKDKVEQGKDMTNQKTIYLAGGCFWGLEAYFERIPGVLDAVSGYANGNTENPSYQDVIAGSGHAETVKVDYDASKTSLENILRYYFRVIDPTSVNKQGNDRGLQYRTGIYFVNPDDEKIAEKLLEQEQKKYTKKLVVELQPLKQFFPAEDYHQDYLRKNPNGYCHIDISLADKPLDNEPSTEKQESGSID